MKALIISISIGLFLLMGSCSTIGFYNNIVTLDESVSSEWSQVENNYQRRSDLIPNLVNTVKGEANFEKSTLTDIISARASATQMKIDPSNLTPEKLKEFSANQGQLSQALGRLMMVTEQYPNLKSNEAFNNLMSQIEGCENRITVARKDFNDVTKAYNQTIKRFPGTIYSSIFGFEKRPYFEADSTAKTAPKVDFGK